MTSQALSEKLKEHNYHTGLWTRGHAPFEMIYSEPFGSKLEALKREKFLKSGDGRRVLDKKIEVIFFATERGGEKFALQIFPK